MVAFGLILLLVGVGGGVLFSWLLLNNNNVLQLSVPGFQIGLLPITVFAAGALSVLLLWMGLRLTALGARRRAARRAEMKELRTTAAKQSRVEEAATRERSAERAAERPRDLDIDRR
ncbi:MAG TPA: hypothetical protein P5181_13650 [Dermatophilaceae bacterium]|nr:hypothetical protein [Dermatophilaceae bacterium]